MTLEQEIKDFISQDLDYFMDSPYDNENYWYLFNLATDEEKENVMRELNNIKASIAVLQEIQDNCYGR